MRLRFSSCSCLILLLIAVSATAAAAATPGQLFANGKREMKAGQYAKAYNSFRQAFLQDPGDLDYSFYMGRAAFEEGDYEKAAMAYDRVLIVQPNAARVKLELARCYFKLGSLELAKQYFSEVLATNPPEAVWQNIQRFLDAIAASERHNFLNGIFSVGMQYDDNVRVTPNENSIFLPTLNIPVQIGKKESDWIYSTTAVINHIYKFLDTPWAWKTSVIDYNTFYHTQNDLNIAYLGLTSGPVRQTDRYLWEFHALGNYLKLDRKRYLGIYGAGSTLTVPFDKKIFFILGGTFQEEKYYQFGDRDATDLRLYGGPVFTVGKNRVAVSLARESENAHSDVNSYTRLSLDLRYDRLLPRHFAFFAAVHLENTDYDLPDPLFPTVPKRSDDLQRFTIGASKRVWRSADKRRSLAAQLSYAYTDAKSNTPIYKYDKNVIATSLTLAF